MGENSRREGGVAREGTTTQRCARETEGSLNSPREREPVENSGRKPTSVWAQTFQPTVNDGSHPTDAWRHWRRGRKRAFSRLKGVLDAEEQGLAPPSDESQSGTSEVRVGGPDIRGGLVRGQTTVNCQRRVLRAQGSRRACAVQGER